MIETILSRLLDFMEQDHKQLRTRNLARVLAVCISVTAVSVTAYAVAYAVFYIIERYQALFL